MTLVSILFLVLHGSDNKDNGQSFQASSLISNNL
jgi:hypothetical protein